MKKIFYTIIKQREKKDSPHKKYKIYFILKRKRCYMDYVEKIFVYSHITP